MAVRLAGKHLGQFIASQLPEGSGSDMDMLAWSGGQGGEEVAQVNWEGLARAVGRGGVNDLKNGLQVPGDASGLGQKAKEFIGGRGRNYGGTNKDLYNFYGASGPGGLPKPF
jgi:hypothetical protein